MKTRLTCATVLLASVLFGTVKSFAQPGSFTVDNNTGCTWLVYMEVRTGTKCGEGTICSTISASVPPGPYVFSPPCGSNNIWTKCYINPGASIVVDCGPNTEAEGGPDCGASGGGSISMSWTSATTAEINP